MNDEIEATATVAWEAAPQGGDRARLVIDAGPHRGIRFQTRPGAYVRCYRTGDRVRVRFAPADQFAEIVGPVDGAKAVL